MGIMGNAKFTWLGLAAVLLWSATVALVRSISEQIGPVAAGAAVYLVGGIISTSYMLLAKNPFSAKRKFPIRYFLSTGSLFLIYTVSLFLAVGLAKTRIEAIELGLVNYLWPGLTILLSLGLLSQRSNIWIVPGTLLAFAGIFLVITAGTDFTWSAFISHIKGNPLA
ncbi:MAG: EamA family transporter, partial [Bacteroidetes bacterium]